jgi:hypothetical protein
MLLWLTLVNVIDIDLVVGIPLVVALVVIAVAVADVIKLLHFKHLYFL